jgi:hypothetical protein
MWAMYDEDQPKRRSRDARLRKLGVSDRHHDRLFAFLLTDWPTPAEI